MATGVNFDWRKGSTRNGFSNIQAAEIANEVLFKGLHFSPQNTIVEILWNEFSDEIPPGTAQQKAAELLPDCKAVFIKYNLSDDYAETSEYQMLYTELTGTIMLLLEDELQ